MSNFPLRVFNLQRKAGIKRKADLAAMLGVSRSMLFNYEKGDPPPPPEVLAKLEKAEKENGLAPNRLREAPSSYAPASRLRSVPVLGWAHAGASVDYEQLPEDSIDLVPTECPDPKAFAVVLEGDSMTPFFDDGDLLVLMPSTRIYSGCYVVGRFAGGGVVFRRLEVQGEENFTLVPENARYQVVTHRPDEFTWLMPVWGRWSQLWKGEVGNE